VIARPSVVSGRPDVADLLHDLSQPLAAIRALAAIPAARRGQSRPAGPDAAEEPESADPPDELGDRLRRIGQLGDWMSDLLRTRRETMPQEPPSADVVRAVEEAVLTAAASFDGDLAWCPSGPAEVLMDPVELRRAVGNVVDNAVRAAGPGGQVEVRVTRLLEEVRVEVADSGPGLGGVPAQTGRGLGVTRDVLHRAGGRLVFDSPRSGGVRVLMTLPLALVPGTV
jgi:signal transduction histidine kinase